MLSGTSSISSNGVPYEAFAQHANGAHLVLFPGINDIGHMKIAVADMPHNCNIEWHLATVFECKCYAINEAGNRDTNICTP
ncbi:hypothetical protein D3C80_1887860 [compost metagenome]